MATDSRSRTVVAEIQKRHLQYLNGLQDLATTPHIGTDTVAATIAQRISELKSKRDANDQQAELDTTKMVREAAETAIRDELTSWEEAVLAWRSTSGAAHGLPWPLFGTSGTAPNHAGR